MTAAGRICIFAGGTGGHVYPALAVARRLRSAGWSVLWVGTRRGLEGRVVPAEGLDIRYIAARQFRGARRPGTLVALAVAIVQALVLMARVRPTVVLGMGGFVSAPGGVAAWIARRPLLIHEQNASPGLANRILARFATGIMETFPGSFRLRRKGWLRTTGNPVRDDIAALAPPSERFAHATDDAPLKLLVIGGSQGAETLNRAVPAAAASLGTGAPRLEIRHQAGALHEEATRARYREAGVEARVTAHIEDMAGAYGWAELVVARAGASTAAELAAAGVGSILVPYPFAADDHQRANARFLEERGAARVLVDEDDIAPALARALAELASDPPRRLAMAEAARRSALGDVTGQVAACCLEFASPNGGTAPLAAGPCREGGT